MSTKRRYVAFIDILGFKSILRNIGSADILGEQMSHILQASIRSALTGDTVYVEENPHLDISTTIKVYQFSDAIVLYTEDDTDESLTKLIVTLNLLLAQSIMRGFPLRGALTCGDLYVKGNIVVGEPFIKAYELEQRQEWSGLIIDCPLHPQFMEYVINEKLVVKHNVVLKDIDNDKSLIVEEKLVINWPQYCGLKITSIEEFKRGMARFSGDPIKKEHIEKRERTIEFLRNNLGSKPLPSFRFRASEIAFNANGTYFKD